MGLTTTHVDDVAIVTPAGMLVGTGETRELENEVFRLLQIGHRKIILDLGKTTYLSSNPIGVLIGIHVKARSSGAAFHICNAAKRIRNVLSLLRVIQVLDLFDDLEEAMKAFPRSETKPRV